MKIKKNKLWARPRFDKQMIDMKVIQNILILITILSLTACNNTHLKFPQTNEYWFESNKQFIKEHIIYITRESQGCLDLHEYYCIDSLIPKHDDIKITFVPATKAKTKDTVIINMHYSFLDAYYIEMLELRLNRLFYFADNDFDTAFRFYIILTT